MNKLSFASVTIDVLNHVTHDIIEHLTDSKVILFYGEMGAGKTTVIKEICRQLGVTDSMSSPTFSVVNEYRTSGNKIIYHFDLYRIKNMEECLDLGMEEYLDSGNYCFIEWPEVALPLLPEKYYSLSIKTEKDNTRSIILS
ncbi:MAG TPA: tRNA (adenosine(37)-N6)-threonylcarbamoyltransferase complex ATPase subunit type 1 TsaE [Bacteroidia bacterium]|nr:tRNA (adenosine(37)-N6)-threonylcarbamoyltransferase complex ATPase subunit type 1 TsaE [Bacteroidia bacterium]